MAIKIKYSVTKELDLDGDVVFVIRRHINVDNSGYQSEYIGSETTLPKAKTRVDRLIAGTDVLYEKLVP